MKEYQSFSHTRWDCKYHVVFIVRRDFELWDPHLSDDTLVERLLLRDGVRGRDSVHAPDPGR